FRGLVREHGCAAHVTDRVDARDVRLALSVRRNEAASVDVDTEFLEPDAPRAGLHANGDEHLVTLDALFFPASADAHRDGVVRLLDALGLGILQDLAAALGDGAFDDPNAVGIDAGQERVGQLDDRQLSSERLIDHAELEPDHAAADHTESLRNLLQADRLSRANHTLAVEFKARDLD